MKLSFIPQNQLPYGEHADIYFLSKKILINNNFIDCLPNDETKNLVIFYDRIQVLNIWFFIKQISTVLTKIKHIEIVHKSEKGYFISEQIRIETNKFLN